MILVIVESCTTVAATTIVAGKAIGNVPIDLLIYGQGSIYVLVITLLKFLSHIANNIFR
jgi:hypothetical protein